MTYSNQTSIDPSDGRHRCPIDCLLTIQIPSIKEDDDHEQKKKERKKQEKNKKNSSLIPADNAAERKWAGPCRPFKQDIFNEFRAKV